MSDVVIGTRKTILKLDSTDYSDEISRCVITSSEADSDFMSFTDANAAGAREYALELDVRQNTDSGSLWYYMWNAAGTEEAVEFWPNGGGTTEGASTPKITGTVVISEPDGDFLGGEAKRSATAVNKVSVKWPFTAKPVIDITP